MYLAPHFRDSDEAKLRELILRNSFATVISYPTGAKPLINHFPIMPDAGRVLIGHMARRNPQWRHFQENPECTMIIHGPHAYISPRWYKSGRDVPTWNYAVAHLHGKIELVQDFEEQTKILHKLSDHFEKDHPVPWKFELPEDLKEPAALTSAIISFRFRIEKAEVKFKFSQNRGEADRLGVIDGLSSRTDDLSRGVREIMLDFEKSKG